MKTRMLLGAMVCAMTLATSAAALAKAQSTPTTGPESELEADQKRNRTHKVHPCDPAFSNNDTTVTNNCGHTGDANVTPEVGNSESSTEITTQNGFQGSVTGFDSNDTLICGPNNKMNLTASGGNVTLGGGTTFTLKVTTDPGAASVTVKMPTGAIMTVAPGSNITLVTP